MPEGLLQEAKPPVRVPTSFGSEGVPFQMPEPDDPASVVPEFHRMFVKFWQGPGRPTPQSAMVLPNEMRLYDPSGWCMPVTEVETGVGVASQPEKKSPVGSVPVNRTKVKSLAAPVLSRLAPSVWGVPAGGVFPEL